MRNFLIISVLLVAIAAGVIWLFFTVNYPSASLRYEVTVEVEANGEVYSGSSVHEVIYGLGFNLAGGGTRGRSSFRGEAVVVEIADRGRLFVLLTGPCDLERTNSFRPHCDEANKLARAVFDLPATTRQSLRDLRRLDASEDVVLEQMPLLVRFDDLSDPASVEYVDPRDLESSFGDSVHLRRIGIETTSSDVTRGIEDLLGWLPYYEEGMLDGHRTRTLGRGFPNSLHIGHLKR